MQITYNLPHVFFPGSDRTENANVLQALLDMLIHINMIYLQKMKRAGHPVPSLYESGVVYGRTRWWEPIPALYDREYGDCKSLTAAIIAEYKMKNVLCRPVFRWSPNPESTDYHILVQTATEFEDPSKVLGMGKDEIYEPTNV